MTWSGKVRRRQTICCVIDLYSVRKFKQNGFKKSLLQNNHWKQRCSCWELSVVLIWQQTGSWRSASSGAFGTFLLFMELSWQYSRLIAAQLKLQVLSYSEVSIWTVQIWFSACFLGLVFIIPNTEPNIFTASSTLTNKEKLFCLCSCHVGIYNITSDVRYLHFADIRYCPKS